MAFRCDSCLFTYDNIVLLRDHLRCNIFSDSSPSHTAHAFTCPLCPPSASLQQFVGTASAFAGAQAFADHIDNAHADLVISGHSPSAADAVVFLSSQSGQQQLLPSASFPDLSSAAMRKRTHDAALLHCTHCARAFKRAWDLRRHMRTHTDERPFGCDKCGRRFRLRTTLADHWHTHQEADAHASQFQCSACAKRFLSRSALKLHMRAHTGEAPFACTESSCTRMFRTKKLMHTHHRNEHQNFDQQQNLDGIYEDEEVISDDWDDERQIAFVALARLNRRRKMVGDGNDSTTGGGRPAFSTINMSEGSAFSNFKQPHQQQHHHHRRQSYPADVQQQQQANNVQSSSNMVLITHQTNASTSLPSSAAVVHQHQQQQLPLSNTPAISGILNNNISNYCSNSWSNKFNSNISKTMMQQQQQLVNHQAHLHHQQQMSSSSQSLSSAVVLPVPAGVAVGEQQQHLFMHHHHHHHIPQQPQRAFTPGAGFSYGTAHGGTGMAGERQLLAQSCLPSL